MVELSTGDDVARPSGPRRRQRRTMDTSRPFTRQQAQAAGITRRQLDGPSYRTLLRGVYLGAHATVDLSVWIAGALLLLPSDAVVSHTTAVRLYGFDPPGRHGLEFSTNSGVRCRVPGIVLHRRKWTLHPREVAGFWTTGPDRTFVDVALRMSLPLLVALGDHLVHHGHTTPEDLRWYAESRHLDGVRRSRRIAPLVKAGAESPRESMLRMMLRFARLPEPELNVNILDELGRFIARGDLVFRRWMVVVEYDGRHHMTDSAQWQHDLIRRERLEAAGWTVIVVTASDMARPPTVPQRVYRALVAKGYRGPAPVTSWQWMTWFAPSTQDVVTLTRRSA